MDNKIEMYKEMVLKGEKLEKEQAMELLTVDLDELCKAADEIRKAFCDNKFDMCTIINGKSGRCSENCKYCAQAAAIRPKWKIIHCFPRKRFWKMQKR